MASVSALRDGLKVRLETISGLRVREYASGEVSPPAAVIIPGDPSRAQAPAINFDATMGRGSDDFIFTVIVMVSDVVERMSNDALDAYLAGSGATSVKAAIEGDGTLGGVAHFTRVVSVREYGRIKYNGVTFLGAEFLVEVCA